MPWHTSTRRHTLPQDWPALRTHVLHRDQGICHICKQPGADQVDHIIPHAQGGTNHDANLAAIHDDPCHRRKSAREGNRAKHGPPRKRPVEKHPGEL